jgi:hypothetical protein
VATISDRLQIVSPIKSHSSSGWPSNVVLDGTVLERHAELLGLFFLALDELHPADAVGEAEVALDVRRQLSIQCTP